MCVRRSTCKYVERGIVLESGVLRCESSIVKLGVFEESGEGYEEGG